MNAAMQHPGLLEWLANGKRGISSEAIVQHLTGIKCLGNWSPYTPADPSDFNRCLMLLDAVPSLQPLLPNMATCSKGWAQIIKHWAEIEACFVAEVGRGWEQRGKAASHTFDLMQARKKATP